MNKTNTENRYVKILSTGIHLEGILSIPEAAKGLVVFVHGSGSSRNSPRNQYVAQMLQEGGLATLLFDLLTAQEEEIDLETRHLRFDINLLARRTIGALEWLDLQPYNFATIGLFGSSTGAAAALQPGAEKKLTIVPGASHLFEEPGTLEYAARLARDWFQTYLSPVNVR